MLSDLATRHCVYNLLCWYINEPYDINNIPGSLMFTISSSGLNEELYSTLVSCESYTNIKII